MDDDALFPARLEPGMLDDMATVAKGSRLLPSPPIAPKGGWLGLGVFGEGGFLRRLLG